MQNGIEKYVNPKKINFIKIGGPFFTIICILLACVISPNFKVHKVKKEDIVQYQFAEIINQKPQATLLNYDFIDGGFYTVTGITPNVKYFMRQNIEYEKYPVIIDEQLKYIKEKKTDFIVVRANKEEDSFKIPYLYKNYNKVSQKYDEEIEGYYQLFEAKE